MSISALSLPIDIPWKRLCVSEDMLDKIICDRQFPFRWRSSVTVFGYEPPDDQQNYEGMIVSYLKVACTVTGFQPDPDEIGIAGRRVDSYWNDPKVINDYKDAVSTYYGAYGAILEVAVAPPDADEEDDMTRWPYFSDFEPKKRELYEMVTDTGESMSRSLEDVNVRKGQTTSTSHEVLDIFGGFGQSAQYAGTGGSTSVQGQWGTRDVTQQEYANLRTTDSARETRETFSHTTQLTQMYHQFDSYHLGTNRAVFFMLPRPHIVQAEATFVNGPRLLEGVQEVFLVVMRPDDMPEICVEAYLETAHVASEPIYHYQTGTGPLDLHIEFSAENRSGSTGDDSHTDYYETSVTYTPPDGWEIDIANGGGYAVDSASGERVEEWGVTEIDADHAVLWGKVNSYYNDRTWPESDVTYKGILDVHVTVKIRKKVPDITGYKQNLWLTGRGLCCGPCAPKEPPKKGGFVTWEHPIVTPFPGKVGGPLDRMKIAVANQLVAEIGDLMRRSVNDPLRYSFGTVRFVDTGFVARRIATLVRRPDHPDNVPVTRIKGIDRDIAAKVAEVAPKVSRGRLLEMSIHEKMDRFGLSAEEAIKLSRATVGLEGGKPPRERRWEGPAEPGK